MPSGCELVLGFEYKDLPWVESSLGMKFNFNEEDEEGVFWREVEFPEIDALLRKAHTAALERMGFTFLREDRLPYWQTPLGERRFSPFSFEVFFDPGEMGEEPEHAVFGVAISGRYFPTFADWRDPHGTLWNIVFDPKQLEWKIAREEIARVLTWMESAKWIVKQRWY